MYLFPRPSSTFSKFRSHRRESIQEKRENECFTFLQPANDQPSTETTARQAQATEKTELIHGTVENRTNVINN